CISPIELIREELALASSEYHMVSKNKDFRKKDPLSDDTIEDKDSLTEISELSDIIDDAKNDDDGNNNHSSQIKMDNSTSQTTEDDIAKTQI
ncbi:11193_t:CDS:2, partial [Funneliformis caledonium]